MSFDEIIIFVFALIPYVVAVLVGLALIKYLRKKD